MKNLFLLVATLFSLGVYAQNDNVGIGTETPNENAKLEILAVNQGLLMPRISLISLSDAAPLSAHVEGMVVYNTATTADLTPGCYYNDGSKWVRIADETLTSLILNADSTHIDYTAEDGNTTQLNLSGIVHNLETLTTIVDNNDGTFTYTDEDGNTTQLDISNMETLTTIALNADSTHIDYTDEDGNTTQLNLSGIVHNLETLTTIVDNNDGTFDYIDEDGDTTDVDLSEISLWQESSGVISPKNSADRTVEITYNSTGLTGYEAHNTENNSNYAGAVFNAEGSGPAFTNNIFLGKYSENYYVPSWQGNGVLATDQDLILVSAGNHPWLPPGPNGFNSDPRILFQVGGGYYTPIDRMVLDAVGLGIGINTPTDKLHVAGSFRLTGAFKDSNNDVGMAGQLLSTTTTGTDWISIDSVETITNLSQDTTSGVITYVNEDSVSQTANVVSADSANNLSVGNDGGAYLGPMVYNGYFIISASGVQTITGLPFQPSQITFVANANIDSLNIDNDNATGNNDAGIANAFGTMNGFARNDAGTISQQVIYIGGSGNIMNNISRYASGSNCIGIRYSDQDGRDLGKITAGLTSFNVDGFTINVTYTNGTVTVNDSDPLKDVQPNDVISERIVVLFTAYK